MLCSDSFLPLQVVSRGHGSKLNRLVQYLQEARCYMVHCMIHFIHFNKDANETVFVLFLQTFKEDHFPQALDNHS